MKHTLLAIFVAVLAIHFTGCGTSEPSSVAGAADKTAIEEYEAMLAADQKAMSADAPTAK